MKGSFFFLFFTLIPFGFQFSSNAKSTYCQWEIAYPKGKLVKKGFFLARKSHCKRDAHFVFSLKNPSFLDKNLFGTEVSAREVPLNVDSNFLLIKLESSLKNGGQYFFKEFGKDIVISEEECCFEKTYFTEDVKKLYLELVNIAEKQESQIYWGKHFEKLQNIFPEVKDCYFEECLGLSLKNAKELGFKKTPQSKQEGKFLDKAFPKSEELKLHFLNKKRIKYYSKILKKRYPYQTKERGVVLHRDYHSDEVEIRTRLHFIDHFLPSCGITTSVKTLKNSESLLLRFLDRFGVKYKESRVKRLLKKKKNFGLAEIFQVSNKRRDKNRSLLKVRRMKNQQLRIFFSSSLCGKL
ncbi:MAG: hypothetical protein NXH75_08395 [Halobacteriovoraceae bacterium]|nr:hypothetical protein [Halobacteriovoraceae bacterium]